MNFKPFNVVIRLFLQFLKVNVICTINFNKIIFLHLL